MTKADERTERLAAQLRENLRRRKAQARAVVAGGGADDAIPAGEAKPPQRDAE